MNERIQKFAVEAEVWANQFEEHWADSPDTYQLFKEKFAELIVRECVQILESRNEHPVIVNSIKEIKETFGV